MTVTFPQQKSGACVHGCCSLLDSIWKSPEKENQQTVFKQERWLSSYLCSEGQKRICLGILIRCETVKYAEGMRAWKIHTATVRKPEWVWHSEEPAGSPLTLPARLRPAFSPQTWRIICSSWKRLRRLLFPFTPTLVLIQVAGQLEARWCVPAVPNHGPI